MPVTRWRRRVAGIGIAGLTVFGATGAASAAAPHDRSTHPKPTVVLVHGAWADSSSWSAVVGRLQHDGYVVDVFATPLRSLNGDSAALRTFLGTIAGPVVLVGHSYGGAVVTDAATGLKKVKALVYADAFAPAEGESVMNLPGPGSVLANPDPTKVFSIVPPSPPGTTPDLYILQSVFPSAFANDLPKAQGKVLAATQRPVTAGALNEPSGAPAWKTIPSWYAVGTIDKVIPADRQLFMAKRAHAHITRLRSGHLPMVSHPRALSQLIEAAAGATR